jgi:hypothetical protein
MLACSFTVVISIMGRLGDEIAITLYEGIGLMTWNRMILTNHLVVLSHIIATKSQRPHFGKWQLPLTTAEEHVSNVCMVYARL